ncbi:hypothetical protein, partial [Listeria booriae]|uniref:hypothetical protein n=1 Tax=Listeria booriae TaxID=1552123 RepID=UPI001C8BDC19
CEAGLDRVPKKPVNPERNWSGRSKNPLLIFAKGVKFPKGWLLRPDFTSHKSKHNPCAFCG